MKSKYLSLDTRWLVLDVRSMPAIPTASVNVAIDKGTLDAFIHGSVWDPPVDVRENVGSYVDEVWSSLFLHPFPLSHLLSPSFLLALSYTYLHNGK